MYVCMFHGWSKIFDTISRTLMLINQAPQLILKYLLKNYRVVRFRYQGQKKLVVSLLIYFINFYNLDAIDIQIIEVIPTLRTNVN